MRKRPQTSAISFRVSRPKREELGRNRRRFWKEGLRLVTKSAARRAPSGAANVPLRLDCSGPVLISHDWKAPVHALRASSVVGCCRIVKLMRQEEASETVE